MHVVDEPASTPEASESASEVAEGGEPADTSTEKLHTTKEKSNYGSATRRAGRNVQKPKAPPPVSIPEWFLERNVILREDLRVKPGLLDRLTPNHGLSMTSKRTEEVESDDGIKVGEKHPSAVHLESTKILLRSNRYQAQYDIWLEVRAHVAAGLQLPSAQYANSFPATKPHLVLHCPEDGGIFFLDAVVESVASDIGADLLCLDPQDIAELGGEYLGDASDTAPYTLRSLGYDAHRVISRQDGKETDDSAEEEDEFDDEQDDAQSASPKGNPAIFAVPAFAKISTLPLKPFQGSIAELLKITDNVVGPASGTGLHRAFGVPVRSSPPSTESSDDIKLSLLIEALLDSCQVKKPVFEVLTEPRSNAHNLRPSSESSNAALSPSEAEVENGPRDTTEPALGRRLIVLIRDYKELNATREGFKVLRKFHEVVRRRRKDGQRILIIGTTSSAALVPSISKSGLKSLQSEFDEAPTRTIVVTPGNGDHITVDSSFTEDLKLRTRQINLRHLRDMIRRLSSDPKRTDAMVQEPDLAIDSAQAFASGLEDSVWPFDRVHRTAVLALGLMNDNDILSSTHIEGALHLVDSSDKAKFDWMNEEQQQGRSADELANHNFQKTPTTAAGRVNDEKMKRLRKSCTTHEKKLLGGVINAENIHTTFADVQAPPENIEALKTLTSLSLIRPEAFTYGVLATDRIPGLLLYGPPGTGKTLLAKAVAKESGATVLEVSGSEVNDMYVGEGEKNVKAIFSLAKKLSPCIVFIDEADAIFGSRGGSVNRTSHRELINQFLREWDGMNDLSAFIMVATNRPFDLDDAVLRRLPRRLLVDLPVEKDREAILKIHLKDENLAPEVSLAQLAAQTPLYSGSDLKNLAVAAALACIREENADAANHLGTEPYKYPEKRTLTQKHFDKAMEEISASISEDMSSLSAIRKFDEKYGDRRGRRKKGAGWGFGTASEAEKKLETGRVRNQT